MKNLTRTLPKKLILLSAFASLLFLYSCESNDNPIVTGVNPNTNSKKVLIELFTNTSCVPCVVANDYLNQVDALSNVTLNDTNVVIVRYHTTLYPNDPFYEFNVPDLSVRQNYYGAALSNPRGFVFGQTLGAFNGANWTSLINTRLSETRSFAIQLTNTFDADLRTGALNIAVSQLSGSAVEDIVLHAILIENGLEYTAPNGEHEFDNVVRDMITPPSGESFSISSGQSVNFLKNYSVDPTIVTSNSKLVVFVQSSSTKEVFAVETKTLN